MKSIWVISHNFDGVMAGPSIRFQRYAPYFLSKGYKLCFVTYSINSELPRFERRESFDIYRVRIGFKPFARTRFISKALILIMKLSGRQSFVLTLGLQTFQLWLLPLIKMLNIKLYYVNTMAANNTFISHRFIGNWWNKIHTYFYTILYNNISGVVCSTSRLSDSFRVFSLNQNKLQIINNGVDVDRFSPVNVSKKNLIRLEKGFNKTDLLFLFVGLKTERKGIREVIETWEKVHAKYPNSKLLLVGDEKQESNSIIFQNWWNKMLSSDRLERLNIINFPGVSDVAPWFQMSDVFIFPSKKEGMPNVVLEAMSCGLPLIMNSFEGYSNDYGSEGETHVLVHLQNNKEVEESLVLMHDINIRISVGKKAREHIERNFSIADSVNSFIQLSN